MGRPYRKLASCQIDVQDHHVELALGKSQRETKMEMGKGLWETCRSTGVQQSQKKTWNKLYFIKKIILKNAFSCEAMENQMTLDNAKNVYMYRT